VSTREVKPTPTKSKRGKKVKAEEAGLGAAADGGVEGGESEGKQEPGRAPAARPKREKKAPLENIGGGENLEPVADMDVESKPKRGRKKQVQAPEEAVFEV
jgi:hypothetical protein